MGPDFGQFIADADAIKTSGRWRALNERVKILTTRPGALEAWQIQVLGSLCYQVFSQYLELHKSYDDGSNQTHWRDVPELAWRARNLLELSVWCIHSAKNKQNARRLYEDAGRDAKDLLRALESWGREAGEPSSWLKTFEEGRANLDVRAHEEGIDSLEGRFMRVESAAEECGIGSVYKAHFKMLSKFTHPTALQILGQSDQQMRQTQRDCFFGLGCLFFTASVNALETAP